MWDVKDMKKDSVIVLIHIGVQWIAEKINVYKFYVQVVGLEAHLNLQG